MKFSELARKVDDRFRFDDLKSQAIEANGQSTDSDFYFGFVLGAMLAGMPETTSSRMFSALIATIMVFAYHHLRTRRGLANLPPGITLAAQLTVMFAVGAPIFFFASPKTDWPFYNNVFVPAMGVTAICLVISAAIAKALFQPLRAESKYGTYLSYTELFQGREFRNEHGLALIWQCTASVAGRPVLLLLPPALVTLICPAWFVHYAAAGMLALTVAYRIGAGVDARLDVIGEVYIGRFLRGAAVLVSIASIALAIARLAGVSYVTTIFDSSSGFTIATFFIFVYAATWWFEYWVDRLLGQELMQLLDPSASIATVIPYPYEGPEYTRVPRDQRELRLHGMGRFLAIRVTPEKTLFHTWSHADFFNALALSGAPGGKAKPQPQLIAHRIGQFRILVAIVTIVAFGGSGWWLSKLPQEAELIVGENSRQGVRLADLLRQNSEGKPFVMVAASGGGTRAALFSGVVLEALHPIGRKRFVAGSGVSGGAAALALYAAKGSVVSDAIKPYIRDVIQRSIEWRMIKGGRTGTLLAESFERGWQSEFGKQHFEQIKDFGLIFNTTLAGHFQRLPGESEPLAELSARHFKRTSSERAGDRLLLTNLDLEGAFTNKQKPVLLTDGKTPLTHAAALSANFPPVFSNAAIDVAENDRYWVTDGGAADNSGLEMLLYSIRHALKDWNGLLPKIHIVVIDASGISDGYAQTRGIDSAIGAGGQFAKYLHAELLSGLRQQYAEQPDDFQITEIHMPRFLREPGAIGTHWMMQPRTRLQVNGSRQTYSDDDIVFAITAAYKNSSPSRTEELIQAIRESPEYKNTWPALLKAIL